MTATCETCRHSIGCDARTAAVLIAQGYKRGAGPDSGMTVICDLDKTVSPMPCGQYEREAGSDDDWGWLP